MEWWRCRRSPLFILYISAARGDYQPKVVTTLIKKMRIELMNLSILSLIVKEYGSVCLHECIGKKSVKVTGSRRPIVCLPLCAFERVNEGGKAEREVKTAERGQMKRTKHSRPTRIICLLVHT